MATTHLISVEEYLNSTYEPDAEYVEGRIIQRALPQKPHGKIQTYLVRALYEAALVRYRLNNRSPTSDTVPTGTNVTGSGAAERPRERYIIDCEIPELRGS
jgi:Uma2 family endonuclease